MELVSLDPENHPVPYCLNNLTDLPIFDLEGSAGGVDENLMPFICGGYRDKPFEYLRQCYKYDPKTDSWQEQGSMPYNNSYSADVQGHI